MDTEQLKKHIEMQKQHLSDYKRIVVAVEMELVAFEAQIAAAEKPELRHGAYGISADGKGFIIIEQSTLIGSPKAFFEDMGGQIEADQRMSDYLRLGDFFKELEALTEPLKELHYGHIACEIRQHELVLKIGETTHYVKAQDVSQFILDLRRLLYTQEQNDTDN